MKRLVNLLRYMPKRFVPMAAALAAIIVPAAVMAWGPSRPTFTMAHPADHITFNSITDNPEVGDERSFLVMKDAANTAAGGWQHDVNAVAGKEYLVRVYVHNDAASNLNLKATNTRVKVNVPATTGKSVELGGFVTADNAAPKEVYDTAHFASGSDFNVAYVAGSAKLYNNHFGQTGAQLSDNIVTSSGAQVGFDKLDGMVPGCIEFSGYVTFKVKIQGPKQANFEMTKKVSKHGANQWTDTFAAQPGETVDYLITYKNTGEVQQDNVVVKDNLPDSETYVPGSTVLGNGKTPQGAKVSDNVTTSGVNIGSYLPGANAWVIFSAKVASNDNLPACGPNKLHNVASVETDNGNKQDTADVSTEKTCEIPKPPKFECTALTVDKISRTQFKFTATKQVENAEFKKFVFVVRDAQGNQIATQPSTDGTFVYEQTKVGKYTVEASVVVMVNGQEKTSGVGDCKKPFEVTEQPIANKFTCDMLDKVQHKDDVKTFDFTVHATPQGSNVSIKEYHFDFGDDQSVIVGPGHETQSHTYAVPGEKVVTVTVTFEVDGKTVPGVSSAKCQQKFTVEQPPVTPPAPPTPPQPGQPSALPPTGPTAIMSGFFGSSALGLGVHAWLGSRRNLRDFFKR